MKLTVKERLMVMGLLPQETNFLTLKIIRKLEEDLGFNEKELKELQFVTEGNIVKWDEAKALKMDKEISIGEKAMDLISEQLKKLDKSDKLTKDHLGLYEKFVLQPDNITQI